jgi:hypothetical protein
LGQAQVIAGVGIGEAYRAAQVAAAGDLDNTDTGMLLVLGAQAAIVGAALFGGGCKVLGNSPRLVVFEPVQVPVSVREDECLMAAVLRAMFAQIDSIVTDEHLSVYHLTTFRAQTACDLVKDVVTNRSLRRGSQWSVPSSH